PHPRIRRAGVRRRVHEPGPPLLRGLVPFEVIPQVNQMDRRAVLRSGLAVAALGAVGGAGGCTARPAASPARHGLIGADSPRVAAAEAARHATGGSALAGADPVAGRVDLGGLVVETWSYSGQIPGPEIRVRKGQVIRAL